MARFQKGNKASKGKGRPKGSKSLKTVLRAEAVMGEAGFNPTQFLVDIAKDSSTPIDLRVKIGIELNGLINPKAKEHEPAPPAPPTEPDADDIPTAELIHLVTPKP